MSAASGIRRQQLGLGQRHERRRLQGVGGDATSLPSIDVEAYHWARRGRRRLLKTSGAPMYEGVVRSNATLRLLKQVVTDKPGEITATDAKGIEGEATLPPGALSLRGVADVGQHSVLPRDDTDFRKANRGRRRGRSRDHEGSRCGHRAAAGDAAQRAGGTRDAVDRQGVQGPRAGVRRPVCRRADDAARGPGPAARTRWRRATISVWTGFQDYANGKETIFAYQASANDGEPNGNNANYGERLNFPHSGSPFGCCGFHQPSQNLVNFFATDAARTSAVALSDPQLERQQRQLHARRNTATPVDPRLDWTVGRDGVPYKDWGLHTPDWIRAPGIRRHVQPEEERAREGQRRRRAAWAG